MTMPTVAAAPRSARGAARREQILSSALALFIDPGYRAVSARDIAAASGISHPGLRRHFASKDDVLLALVERFERETARLAASEPAGASTAVTVARRNAEMPGYLQVFTALAGEATAPAHPAHERMRERYRGLRSIAAEQYAADQLLGHLGDGRDASSEALRLMSAWDGLQLLQLYLPDRVDVAGCLEAHGALVARPVGWRAEERTDAAAAPLPPMTSLVPDTSPELEGYAAGRARREQIVSDATALFAAEGYGDTSLRDVAERVGVSKSAIFHYYETKEDLLRAVLATRDARIGERVTESSATSAARMLRELPEGAAGNAADAPGLIEVYSVLSCEAVPVRHPAHEYFARRFRRVLDDFTALFEAAARDGDLPAHRDPAHEAAWLTALWDGLQIQWLYDRDGIDVAAQLRAHLSDVLPA